MSRTWAMVLTLGLGLALLLTSGGYRSHCGRCADQKTEIKLLWVTVATPEPHYDEYGIVERWEKAHPNQGPCPNIWLAGPFDPKQPDPQYWPRLHFRVAAARRGRGRARSCGVSNGVAESRRAWANRTALARHPSEHCRTRCAGPVPRRAGVESRSRGRGRLDPSRMGSS